MLSIITAQYMLKICNGIDHALYINTTCWFKGEKNLHYLYGYQQIFFI